MHVYFYWQNSTKQPPCWFQPYHHMNQIKQQTYGDTAIKQIIFENEKGVGNPLISP